MSTAVLIISSRPAPTILLRLRLHQSGIQRAERSCSRGRAIELHVPPDHLNGYRAATICSFAPRAFRAIYLRRMPHVCSRHDGMITRTVDAPRERKRTINSVATSIENLSRRGYTFHESIDAANLNHMSGRVQDPLTGRFLSADHFVTEIDNTQSWNRYSYVNNNPLSYVDPSEYFLKKLFKTMWRFFKQYWRPVVAIVAAVVTYGAVSGAIAAHAGAAAGSAATAAVSTTRSW